MRAVILVTAFLFGCTATSDPPSQASSANREVDLVWASYQMHTEPHYRLVFEGGSDLIRPTEVRVVMPSGAPIASAPTVPSDGEAIRFLCGPTKKSVPRSYGPLRATVAMPEQLFKDFIRQPADFGVEAKIGDAWRPTRLTLLCHVQE